MLSCREITINEIKKIFNLAYQFENDNNCSYESLLKNKIIISAFFQPSTRTSLSFQIASKKLGAIVIPFNEDNSSTKKGERVF